MRASLNPLDWIVLLVIIIGGINWGLIALFEWDLVAELLGDGYGATGTVPRIVYGVIGVAALYMIFFLVRYFPRRSAS